MSVNFRKIKEFLKMYFKNKDSNFVDAVIAFVALILISFLVIEHFGPSIKDNNDFAVVLTLVSILVLAATFFAIFWNTLETRSLKKLQGLQIELELKPIIVILIKKEIGKYVCDIIKNVGKGVANNLKINDFIDDNGDIYKFYAAELLEPGQEAEIKVKKVGDDLKTYTLSNITSGREIRMGVWFESVDATLYKSVLLLTYETTRILEQVG